MGTLVPQEVEIFEKHNLENSAFLLEVEIKKWLIESLINKWDVIHRVFQFGSMTYEQLSKNNPKY